MNRKSELVSNLKILNNAKDLGVEKGQAAHWIGFNINYWGKKDFFFLSRDTVKNYLPRNFSHFSSTKISIFFTFPRLRFD